MSKELEAFSNLKGYLIAYGMGNSPSIEVVELYLKSQTSKLYFDKCAESDMWEKTSRELATDLDKLLTPPTEEEVCEALSEYLNRKVTYYNRSFYYQFRNELGDGSSYIATLQYDNTIDFEHALPLNIVKMIVKFYEGIESHEQR